MKKKKNQKKKNKRKSLILLLFLTIIMFGTSTYAWFTANRVVTINDINVSVQASEGIQISTDAVNWKSVITNTDITNGYSGSGNQLPSTVTAVSTAGVVDTDPESTTKGQLPMYIASISNANDGSYQLTATRDPENAGHYIAFDVFLRVNKDQVVYLTPDSKVINKEGETDKGLKNASRVAFAYKGHAESNETSANLISLNNPTATATIWEPNAEAHSDVVVNSVAPDYGVTLGTPKTTYYGLKTAVPSAVSLKTIVKSGISDYTSTMTTTATASDTTDYTQILSLTAGITKYRVYMWIEGQDIDCENNATGSNIIFKLQLSTDNGTSSAASSSNG